MLRRANRQWRLILSDESAQDLVEYVLLAALIGAGIVLAWNYILSSSISTVFLFIANRLLAMFSS